MTREETIEEIKSWTPILLSSPNLSDKAGEAMDMAISALSAEGEPTEDDVHEFWLEAMKSSGSLADSAEGEYIKKEDALNDRKIYALWNGSEKVYVVNADYLKSLPVYSFPDREKGEWELDESDNSVRCKKCGCFLYPSDISDGEAHFCPNCGADMRGKANETDN